MWKEIKQTWQRFRAGKPGRRFQQEYRRHGTGRTAIQKLLPIVGGLVLMAVGFLLLFIPGPGLIFLFVGGFLIAQQSLVAARMLDWGEICLRWLLHRSVRAWRRSSMTLKVVLVAGAAVVLGATGLGIFMLLDNRSPI